MGLALLTVMLVTPVVLTNLRTCFLVFTCVGLTLVCTILLHLFQTVHKLMLIWSLPLLRKLLLCTFLRGKSFVLFNNRSFPHSTSVRTNNNTRARLGWTFSQICCIFVHPDLDLAPLCVGMRETSIRL